MMNEDSDPMMSGLKNMKRTRNLNKVSETINASLHQRGNSIDASFDFPHNAS